MGDDHLTTEEIIKVLEDESLVNHFFDDTTKIIYYNNVIAVSNKKGIKIVCERKKPCSS